MILPIGLRLLGRQDSILQVAALLHLEHAAPHMLEMIEPIGYGSAHKHLSLGSFRSHMLRIPGPALDYGEI